MQDRSDVTLKAGWPELDRMLGNLQGGIRPGEILVMGGRPAAGRSDLARHLAERGIAYRVGPGVPHAE